ncbi:MAG TPA: hypothetical protein VK574_04680 [Terracidiphilus sp.]|nr:hypothetical protein [Terracidiphilus sp.]
MTKYLKKPRLIRWLLLPVVLASALALPVLSQSSAALASSTPSEPKLQTDKAASQSSHPTSLDSKPEARPEASAEEVRQAQIEEDTKKLYQLSAELRTEVANTYKESLSLTVLKKAEEVEKLARDLKLLMKQEATAARK